MNLTRTESERQKAVRDKWLSESAYGIRTCKKYLTDFASVINGRIDWTTFEISSSHICKGYREYVYLVGHEWGYRFKTPESEIYTLALESVPDNFHSKCVIKSDKWRKDLQISTSWTLFEEGYIRVSDLQRSIKLTYGFFGCKIENEIQVERELVKLLMN
jgi:hypothetical protein